MLVYRMCKPVDFGDFLHDVNCFQLIKRFDVGTNNVRYLSDILHIEKTLQLLVYNDTEFYVIGAYLLLISYRVYWT